MSSPDSATAVSQAELAEILTPHGIVHPGMDLATYLSQLKFDQNSSPKWSPASPDRDLPSVMNDSCLSAYIGFLSTATIAQLTKLSGMARSKVPETEDPRALMAWSVSERRKGFITMEDYANQLIRLVQSELLSADSGLVSAFEKVSAFDYVPTSGTDAAPTAEPVPDLTSVMNDPRLSAYVEFLSTTTIPQLDTLSTMRRWNDVSTEDPRARMAFSVSNARRGRITQEGLRRKLGNWIRKEMLWASPNVMTAIVKVLGNCNQDASPSQQIQAHPPTSDGHDQQEGVQ